MTPFIVESSDADIRLDRWIRRHTPQISQGRLQQALRKGMVKLDGKKTETAVRVHAGQTITIAPLLLQRQEKTPHPEAATRPALTERQIREIRSWVLYEDAHCIALNKPAGIAVQGGSGVKDSIDLRLDALRQKEGERPRLVHRLDKDTSGVLLLAKTARDAARLTRAFAEKSARKTYWALVIGVPAPRAGEIDMPLAKLRIGGEERMGGDEEGKRAVTLYRVLDTVGKELALVEMIPVTGRTHQLRVHMATLGHPILGDGKYGGKAAFLPSLELAPRLHLHARRLALEEAGLDVTAPLPPHLRESMATLGFTEPRS
jgi:23S rRNA pseudouridine955/2504/2580 synthase